MFRNNKQVFILYLLIDVIFLLISFYLPFKISCASAPGPTDLEAVKTYLTIYFFWGVTLIFILNNTRLYTTNRYLSISKEFILVIKSIAFSSIFIVLIIFALKISIFSRLIFFENIILLVLTLTTWRSLKRIYVRHLINMGYANYHVLIVGAGKSGQILAEEIKDHPFLGIKVVGFLDDEKTHSIEGLKILGKIENLEEIARKEFVDEIYVTIPSERRLTAEIIKKGMKLNKTVRILADYFDSPGSCCIGLNYIGIMPLMTYLENDKPKTENILKRTMDLSISTLALLLLSPIFLIIALLIKLGSPGPVFYISKRCGKKGNIFNFYKFRSMINDAEQLKEGLRHRSEIKGGGPIFKMKSDPRITPLGKFLRKYSLDELPQLINVLKGDMSLVGPRPFPVEESHNLENRHLPRMDIRPGITGLAQIKGRSDLPFHQWAKWDLWYSDHWSLGLDFKILLWTIPAVFKAKGAY